MAILDGWKTTVWQMFLIALVCLAASPTLAQSSGTRPLSEILDPRPLIAADDFDGIRAVAQRQADPASSERIKYESPRVETVTFEGFVFPIGANMAIFSDDGSSVYIDGQLLSGQDRAGQDQDMRNLNVTLRVLHRPAGSQAPYHFRVVYTNTIHTNSLDLDGAGLFVWGGPINSVYPGRLSALTATEVHDTTATSNSLTVSSVTDDTLYKCPGNTVRLSLPGSTPPRGRVLFVAEGTGVSPASGNFSTDPSPTLTIPDNILVLVRAGTDVNANGTLDADEVTQSLRIKTQRLGNAKVDARRSSLPNESLYRMKSEEHYEIGGTFEFVLAPGSTTVTGPGALISHRIWDTAGLDLTIHQGRGATFEYTFAPLERNKLLILTYDLDADDSGTSNNGGETSQAVLSPTIAVREIKTWSLKIEVSDVITEFAGKSRADIESDVRKRLLEAGEVVLRKDSADDWRACVRFEMESLNIFTSGPTTAAPRPDPVPNDRLQQDKHFLAASDVVFVDELRGLVA